MLALGVSPGVRSYVRSKAAIARMGRHVFHQDLLYDDRLQYRDARSSKVHSAHDESLIWLVCSTFLDGSKAPQGVTRSYYLLSPRSGFAFQRAPAVPGLTPRASTHRPCRGLGSMLLLSSNGLRHRLSVCAITRQTCPATDEGPPFSISKLEVSSGATTPHAFPEENRYPGQDP